jgi:hypothetical protein
MVIPMANLPRKAALHMVTVTGVLQNMGTHMEEVALHMVIHMVAVRHMVILMALGILTTTRSAALALLTAMHMTTRNTTPTWKVGTFSLCYIFGDGVMIVLFIIRNTRNSQNDSLVKKLCTNSTKCVRNKDYFPDNYLYV